MPQMKPINWINLFILMNLIITFLNIMNYYNKNNMMMTKKMNMTNLKKNWKW